MIWAGAPAGLVRGPARLKMVRKPRARRRDWTRFIAGWSAGAKRKVNPVARRQSADCRGVRATGTPRASRTSAEPHFEVMPRLPCLATLAPAAAATRAAAVEML